MTTLNMLSSGQPDRFFTVFLLMTSQFLEMFEPGPKPAGWVGEIYCFGPGPKNPFFTPSLRQKQKTF